MTVWTETGLKMRAFPPESTAVGWSLDRYCSNAPRSMVHSLMCALWGHWRQRQAHFLLDCNQLATIPNTKQLLSLDSKKWFNIICPRFCFCSAFFVSNLTSSRGTPEFEAILFLQHCCAAVFSCCGYQPCSASPVVFLMLCFVYCCCHSVFISSDMLLSFYCDVLLCICCHFAAVTCSAASSFRCVFFVLFIFQLRFSILSNCGLVMFPVVYVCVYFCFYL